MARKLSAYNRYMRTALKGKMKGKTKTQRKAIFRAAAKGWKKKRSTPKHRDVRVRVVKSPTRKGARPSHLKKSTGGNRRMAKAGFLNFRTIKRLVQLGALAAPAASIAMGGGPPEEKLRRGLRIYTGFNMADMSFSWSMLSKGWMPYVATVLITEGIQKATSMIRKLF